MPNPLDSAIVFEMTDYDSKYWKKKIFYYSSTDWVHEPLPFAIEAEKYFSGKRILELGAGAGQDSIWFDFKGYDVTVSDGEDSFFDEMKSKTSQRASFAAFDITQPFPFEDSSFDVVYAHLVLHYFNDETMKQIVSEIRRVLVKGGVVACMVNSVNDPEFELSKADKDNIMNINGLKKRFFSKESLEHYFGDFEIILCDEMGRTPKDDALDTTSLVRLIGRLK